MTSIEELSLSGRIKNLLFRAGIESVEQLQQSLKNNTLTNIKGVGIDTLNEIREQLNGETAQRNVSHIHSTVIFSLADNNMKLEKTAQSLGISRQKLNQHITSIYRITKLNPRNFYDLQKLLSMDEYRRDK